MLKEVTGMCGWQTRGTADEVVAAPREEILALAVDLSEVAEDADTA